MAIDYTNLIVLHKGPETYALHYNPGDELRARVVAFNWTFNDRLSFDHGDAITIYRRIDAGMESSDSEGK